ncbi:MAG: hypothetical protein RLZZ455_1076 [Candidatus Parcubacteria bacterium]|jgi:LPXTG-site transpeptidase (sortase) family protein
MATQFTSRKFGNILIILSCLIFLSFAALYFYIHLDRGVQDVPRIGYMIEIPKISAFSPIIVGVDPWNRQEYNDALTRGIAQAKNTYAPGRGKLIYLFAHSSGSPFELLSRNTPFLRLDELNRGDKVNIYVEGTQYRYSVSGKKIVSPTELTYLQNTAENVLILQTCWPLGTDWKRLLVFATPL